MKIYIAGKITGDPDYVAKFARIEKQLLDKGHAVMNPAWIGNSAEFDYDDYIAISSAMQKTCDAAFFISDWKESNGARGEHGNAEELQQIIFYKMADVPEVR